MQLATPHVLGGKNREENVINATLLHLFQRPVTERNRDVYTTKIVMCSPKQCLCSVDVGEALGLYHAIEWIHES